MPKHSPAPRTRRTRGTTTKEDASFVGAWIPDDILQLLDMEVARQDSDRSKEIRKALRRHLRAS